jgi:hypothetical protein
MKKLGLVFVGSWLINKSVIILSSVFLDLSQVARIGLTIQLLSILGTFSTLFYNSYSPLIMSTKLLGHRSKSIRIFSLSLVFQWAVGLLGILFIYFFGRDLLKIISSNDNLLSGIELILISVTLFLEWNHSTFASYISLSNRIPFTNSSLLSGIGVLLLSYFLVGIFNFGVFGLIFSQFFIQLLYNNWKWPLLVLSEERMTISKIFKDSVKQLKEILQ